MSIDSVNEVFDCAVLCITVDSCWDYHGTCSVLLNFYPGNKHGLYF